MSDAKNDLMDDLQFTCPKCGGHFWGSGEDRGPRPAPTAENPHPYLGTGICNSPGCGFTWLRPEQDHIVLLPTGKKISRNGVGCIAPTRPK